MYTEQQTELSVKFKV